LGGLLAIGALLVNAPPVHAEGPIEEVVVTGSYIKRAPEDAPSPVRVMGREELEVKGKPQLADLVATLPSVIGSENVTAQEQSVGGAGAANINIRNLGLASTLVLIDGKRVNVGTSVSNQGEQFVDINRIPFIMVENVEILKDGASALYGSDAVAGVANFKLRNRFEGFEVQGMYQDSFKSRDMDFDDYDFPEIYREPIQHISEDDSKDVDVGAIWGFGNDTTHFVIGANYFERDSIDTVDREFSFEDTINPNIGGPSPFNLPQDQFASQIIPGVGEIPGVMYIQDSSCAAMGYYRTRNAGLCSTKTDLLSRDLFSDERRKQLMATFTHDINDSIEAYGHFGASENEVYINQSPSFPITSQVNYTADNPGLRYEVFNGLANAIALGDDVANRLVPVPFPVISFIGGIDPTNPAAVLDAIGNVTFNGVVRPSLANLRTAMGVPADVDGDGVVEPGEIFKDRAHSTIDRDTRIFMTGLRGDLNDEWTFDVSYNFSKEEGTTTYYDTVTDRLDDALNGYFGIGCDPRTMAPGTDRCTWFNPFGSSLLFPDVEWADGNGNLHTLGNDAAYVASLIGEGVVNAETRLTVVDAVFSTGEIMGWTLPGGSVGFAVGGQYRKEEQRVGGNELATDQSFPFSFTGPTVPYSADQDIWALFAEFALPVTEALEAQVAIRYEDYGGDTGDTIDPKLSLRWEALENVVLRGSIGTSFRGPSLNQKYGRGTGLQFTSPPDPEVVAELTPGQSYGSGVFARLPTYGNEELQPEESVNFNIGVIWDITEDWQMSVDYFSYDYDDIIVSEDFRGLANDCQIAWGQAGRPLSASGADTLGIEPCNFRNLDDNALTPDIQLDTRGNPLNIQQSYVNGTELKASGLDLVSRYGMDTDFGAFGATFDLSWFLEYEIDRAITPYDTRLNPGETVDMVGNSENVLVGRPLPEYKATLLIDWSLSQHYAALVTNYVSDITEPGAVPLGDDLRNPTGYADNRVASYTTMDAAYTYNFEQVDLSLTLGAVNLFDRDPPAASGFNGFESTIHDPRGRLWYMRARYGF